MPPTPGLAPDDPHRPRYHFLPPSQWMNDPNGLIEVDGVVHLFYQYNPHGAQHGTIHWGHAASADLVHWEDWPIALAPTPGGPDAGGCWSGCAVNADGTPTLIYTGVWPQAQCLATSSDGLVTWDKLTAPIVAAPPPGVPVIGETPEFRDPFVWREGDTWRMVVGSGLADVGGAVLAYHSRDLRAWTFDGVAHAGRFDPDGTIWECPNLFSLGQRHVLLVSEQPRFLTTHVQTGHFDGRSFRPAWTGKADHGVAFYAALTFANAQGRRIMFGWLKEERTPAAQVAAGWSGVMSLPRELALVGDRLVMRPAPELRALRRAHVGRPAFRLEPGSPPALDVAGDALEFRLALDALGDAELVLGLRASRDGREVTTIHLDGAASQVRVDTRRSSLDPAATPSLSAAPHEFGASTVLHVYLDRSVVEVFVDELTCVSARVYPSCPDSVGVTLEVRGGAVGVRALDVWQMGSIWDGG